MGLKFNLFNKRELKDSGLPNEIQSFIWRIIRRTGLRTKECRSVVQELIEHFNKTLASGIDPSTAITEYGKIKSAAKAFRKERLRQRGKVDRAITRTFMWIVYIFWIVIFLYIAIAALTLSRKPNIAIDYFAKLNEVAEAVLEEDRAWPIYREVRIALLDNPEPEIIIDGEEVWPYTSNDPGWSEYAAWLDTHVDTLELIRQGAAKKGLGYIVTSTVLEEDRELFPPQFEFEYEPGVHRAMLMDVLHPKWNHMHAMVRLLHDDTKRATEAGNREQCKRNIDSVFRMAKQLSEHPWGLSESMLRRTIFTALITLREVLEFDSEFFSSQQLDEFKTELRTLDPWLAARVDSDRLFVLDAVQRMYTDDGRGDGSLVPYTLFYAIMNGGEVLSDAPAAITVMEMLITPYSDYCYATRKELVDEYERRLAAIEAVRGTHLYEWSTQIDSPITWRGGHLDFNDTFALLNQIMLNPSRLLQEKYMHVRRDGMLAVLYAVEQFQTTGEWPTDLSGAGVVDGWSGEPLKIVKVDGSPVIYSVGADQDDDGGRDHRDAFEWRADPSKVADGDWVFFSLKQ